MAGAIHIGERSVGLGSPCFLIAEAGVNHNGDVELGHRLVEAAAAAGADAVKFQTFDPARLSSAEAPCADYQKAAGETQGQRQMLERLALSRDAHVALKRHAEERGLVFLSSPFDEASADFLDAIGIAAFKVPSGEAVNHSFLAHIARKGRPVLLSTGMCDMGEVAAAVDVVRGGGATSLALFHCVSNYPAAAVDANLRAMSTLEAVFHVPVGWSDHTPGLAVAIAAVGLGAQLLEKHLTLDKDLAGPDHKASLDPVEWTALARATRDVESALGTGVKAPVPAEAAIAAVARKSLHWVASLARGALIEASDLTAMRPGTGLLPYRLKEVVGRRLREDVQAGTLVRPEVLEPAP